MSISRVANWAFSAVCAVGLIFARLAPASASAPPKSPIAWNPAKLSVQVPAGQSAAVGVVFTTTVALTNPTIVVTPAKTLVSITAAGLPAQVPAGTAVPITLTVALDAARLQRVRRGRLHRAGHAASRFSAARAR